MVYRTVNAIIPFHVADSTKENWIPVIEKLVLTLSDQQLLTGLAVLIAAFWTHCSISVYHFALVNDLAWFSSNVHLVTLSVLRRHLLANRVLRNWRVALMVAMALLLVASTVMQGHREWYDGWPYDAQCFFENLIGNIGGTPKHWMIVNLVLICVDYPRMIISLFERPMGYIDEWLETKPKGVRDQAIEYLEEKILHTKSRNILKGSMRRFAYKTSILVVRAISTTYFSGRYILDSQTCDLALNTFWFAYSLWSIIEDRDIPSSDMNGDENAMTFGQIMPILLLSSILLVFREAYDGT